MVTINIRTFVKAALDPFRDELDSRKISLDVQVPDQNVVADTMGLSIALRNLLENAIKFTRSVSDPHIRIELTESESGWIISVRDNGIGIEKKYQKRVFEIFQRLHRIEDYPGTGIGLAMVQKAMQRMNGTARVQSSLGKGSTFFLELPKIF